jgi:aldehyde:ferredoxin oxidoreductase
VNRLTQEEASAAMTICSIVSSFGRALELEQAGYLAEGRVIRDQIDDTLRTESDLHLIATGALGALTILADGDGEFVAHALWLDTTFADELGELEDP